MFSPSGWIICQTASSRQEKCHSDFSRICISFVYLSKNVRTCKETKNTWKFLLQKKSWNFSKCQMAIIDFLKVSKFQNEFMKSSFLPKYEPKIVRISAAQLGAQYRAEILLIRPLKFDEISQLYLNIVSRVSSDKL